MVRNQDIAEELCIDVTRLNMKCSKHKGTFLAWLSREILTREYDRLWPSDREELLDILRIMVTDGYKGSNMVSDLFNNKRLGFMSPSLNRLSLSYSHGNPFGIKF